MKRLCLVLFILCAQVGSLASGNPYTTIVDNGPSSNRVDIVFLGDGYTVNDIGSGVYGQHVTNYLDHMFANSLNSEPFYRYRNFFNVHQIDVESNETGADAPPEGIFRDTALDASYYFDDSTERLLYISTSKANAARDAGLAGAGFSAEMQFVTVNDTRYGGGGGSYAVFAGDNFWSSEIALHEIGHSFSNLADEYGGLPGPYSGPEPTEVNVTKNSTGAKWSRWHGYNQPGIGVIGAYEGGRYNDTGIYRPSNDSKMRSLDRPFDAVSREKIILDIFDYVDPFDAWMDNSLPLVDPGDLFVERSDDDVIDVEWFVDDVLVPAAIDDHFDLTDYGYSQGTYAVIARGFDPTAFDATNGWVRIDQHELEQYISWEVTITHSNLLAADFDEDGDVDGDDFLAWQTGFGMNSGASRDNGDTDDDGDVDGDDFLLWQSQFGSQAGQGAAGAIPEPTTGVLLLIASTAIAFLKVS